MSQSALPITDEERQRISDAAGDIYDRKLKAILEPEHNGKIVVIHIDSEDYEVHRLSSRALGMLRARHPVGFVVTTDIGPVDPYDTLSLRMLASKMLADQKRNANS